MSNATNQQLLSLSIADTDIKAALNYSSTSLNETLSSVKSAFTSQLTILESTLDTKINLALLAIVNLDVNLTSKLNELNTSCSLSIASENSRALAAENNLQVSFQAFNVAVASPTPARPISSCGAYMNGSVQLPFTPAVTGAVPTYFEASLNSVTVATGSSSPLIVAGLTGGLNYSFGLTAVGSLRNSTTVFFAPIGGDTVPRQPGKLECIFMLFIIPCVSCVRYGYIGGGCCVCFFMN